MPELFFDWNDDCEKDGTYLCFVGEVLRNTEPVVIYEVGQEVTFGDSEISRKGNVVSIDRYPLVRVALIKRR